MLNRKIAAYTYPANVILVDDNKGYLNKACFDLEEHMPYRLFDNPEQALQYFKREYKFQPLINRCLSTSEVNIHLGKHHDMSLNISAIRQEVFNPHRFREVAVMLVDYNMPDIDGLELAGKIANLGLPIKIVLVTAAADERTAVQAFNKGIIHRFVLKNNLNFAETINQSIAELQHVYFQEVSEGFIRPLIVDQHCVLNKPAFIQFFYDLCKQHKIAEFYLYDASGSFLMLDYNGNPSWLIIKNAMEMDDYYDLARDSKASATVLDYLKEGKMVPFFAHPEELDRVKGLEWENYLYPAKRLAGTDQAFFYTVIQNKPEFLPDYKEILSHNQYMNKVWPEL